MKCYNLSRLKGMKRMKCKVVRKYGEGTEERMFDITLEGSNELCYALGDEDDFIGFGREDGGIFIIRKEDVISIETWNEDDVNEE